MSSTPFAATIEIALRPSLRALALLFWAHLGALALSLIALRPGAPMALVAVGIAVSWIWTRRHPAFGYGRRALTRLTWQVDGRWTVQDAAGAREDAELLDSSIVHERLVLLRFRVTGATRSRALLGDELTPDQLRRLRARLRHGQAG